MECRNENEAAFHRYEVVENDTYKLRRLVRADIRTIIDVGANYGWFSVYSRFMFPKARIFAIEGCKETFEGLKVNVKNLNISVILAAIGDGSPVVFEEFAPGNSGSTAAVQSDEPNSIPTFRLLDLLNRVGVEIDEHTLIKMDIEGSESHILFHNETMAEVNKAAAIVAELHISDVHKAMPGLTGMANWVFQHTLSTQREVSFFKDPYSTTYLFYSYAKNFVA